MHPTVRTLITLARFGTSRTVDALRAAAAPYGLEGAAFDAAIAAWRDYIDRTGGPKRATEDHPRSRR